MFPVEHIVGLPQRGLLAVVAVVFFVGVDGGDSMPVGFLHGDPKVAWKLIDQGHPKIVNLQQYFGNIDIYVFDQILRGRIAPGMRILDAGCGYGRNLVYFFQEGYEVFGVDQDADAIASLPAVNFRVESIEKMSFPDAFADVVIGNAVLHFANNDQHFRAMVLGMWRVLKPGGMLFSRLASTIGMERQVIPISGRRHLLPDGSERYLVDEKLLVGLTEELGGQLLDPLKTTVVQDARSMTTWVIRKNS